MRLQLGALAGMTCLLLSSCGSDEQAPPPLDCSFGGGAGAPSTCLKPTLKREYYVDQGLKYFDSLDTSADPTSLPTYSDLVARWEWPPWLKLTGYTRQTIVDVDKLVKKAKPVTVPERECRAFDVQPFTRCHVRFQYDGGPCAIYEEFTFNDEGQITFIEAWTETPTSPGNAADRWAEGPAVRRLSTRVPGLGNATGRIDLDAAWMTDAASRDADLADLVTRARDFWGTWFEEVRNTPGDAIALGCGW
jgi:hypothetical protein